MNKWQSETRIVTDLVHSGRPGYALAAICVYALRALAVVGVVLAIILVR